MKKLAVLVALAGVVAFSVAWVLMRGGGGEPREDEGAGPSSIKQPPAHMAENPIGRDTPSQPAGKGMTAIEKASKANKYLFIFFYKGDDEQTRKMREVFKAASEAVADRAESVAISIDDNKERALVEKFQLSRAPMPLALVLASNGAVVGGFPVRFSKEQLTEAFVSPCMEKAFKALQDKKFVLLCVQNASSGSGTEAMKGVREFKSDATYAASTEIIVLDPAAQREEKFLRQLKVDPKGKVAVTIFLAPPGSVIGTFEGETTKSKLVAALQACETGCGPSSGST